MLIEHNDDMQAQVDALKCRPPQTVTGSAAESLESAIRYMMTRPEPLRNDGDVDIEVVVEYAKNGQRAYIQLARYEDSGIEIEVSAVWHNDACLKCRKSKCCRRGFEIDGRRLDDISEYPYEAYWRSLEDFMSLGFKSLSEGKNGWSVLRIGYQVDPGGLKQKDMQWKWTAQCDRKPLIDEEQ